MTQYNTASLIRNIFYIYPFITGITIVPILRIIELDEYIKKNHLEIPDNVQFQKIVDDFGYTKLDVSNTNVTNLTYERGILQYGLIKKYAPTNILEFGTGTGFSILCMALAMHQIHENGNLFTIDYFPHNEKFQHYYKKQNKIHVKYTTRYDHWKDSVFSHLLNNVTPINGFSSEIISKHTFPKIQFFNSDISGSFYTGIKNDFFSSLMLSDSKSYYLFNAYADTPFGIGVKKFVDEEIASEFDVELIVIDKSNYWIERGVTNSPYGMCFFEINKDEMIEHFGLKNIEEFRRRYRRLEKRLKFRAKVNKKFPFLKNIKLSTLFKS